MTADGPNHLPLEDLHVQAGTRFGAFAGWSMPLTYPLGVLKEHLWTRAHAGLFDISHMRLFELNGPAVAEMLDRACPMVAETLPVGRSKYTFFLAPNAGILDDLIVTRLGPERFMVVANAGNAAADEAHLRALAGEFGARVEPLDRVFLALQGPEAEGALNAAFPGDLPASFMTGLEPRPGWFMTRSGYTGEDGFEIALPEEDARTLVSKLLTDERVSWIGLAARDSLRLEAGLCLHGQDITPATDPASAGLMWAILRPARERGRFIGAEALAAIAANGPSRRRVGLRPEGRQPVRAGAALFDASGTPVGTVTSGGFGPSVEHPVAMGAVAAPLAQPGAALFAEVRGSRVPVSVHPLPFTPHRFRKG
ncbi:MAG TPA: glycine cleavage system aminomethyltransferase GcvT [Mesorhizobium sp.]|nr:glycine cleavage system aminomethyltransferase GcvT [Mesorhizobium sp.]